MFNLVTSWQHMATFQTTTTRTYQDRTCRVCPTYSLESQGCAAWLPATTALKVGQTWKNNVVNKDPPRCFKMFQLSQKDVWISGHLFLNFRRSLLHVSYDLTKKWKIHGKPRSMSPLQFSKPGTWLLWISWQHRYTMDIPPKCYILFMYSELQKKPIDPLVNMFCWKIRYLAWWSSLQNLHLVGCSSSPPLISPFLESFFPLRPWPVGKLWWGFVIQVEQSSQT